MWIGRHRHRPVGPRGGRLITPDDPEWPVLALTSFAAASRTKPQGWPPLVLWAQGPASLDEVAMRSAAIVGTRAATTYGEYVRPIWPAGWSTRRGGGVRRRAMASTGPHTGPRWPPRGQRSRYLRVVSIFLTPQAIPRCSTESVPAGCWSRSTRRGRPARVSVPHPQPAGRRILRGHRGRRSRTAQRHGQHRGLGARAGPGGVRGAGSGHQCGIGRMSRVVARGSPIGHPGRRGGRAGAGRVGQMTQHPPRPVTPLDGLGEAERQVYEALPCAAWRPPTRSPSVGIAAGPGVRTLGDAGGRWLGRAS